MSKYSNTTGSNFDFNTFKTIVYKNKKYGRYYSFKKFKT